MCQGAQALDLFLDMSDVYLLRRGALYSDARQSSIYFFRFAYYTITPRPKGRAVNFRLKLHDDRFDNLFARIISTLHGDEVPQMAAAMCTSKLNRRNENRSLENPVSRFIIVYTLRKREHSLACALLLHDAYIQYIHGYDVIIITPEPRTETAGGARTKNASSLDSNIQYLLLYATVSHANKLHKMWVWARLRRVLSQNTFTDLIFGMG